MAATSPKSEEGGWWVFWEGLGGVNWLMRREEASMRRGGRQKMGPNRAPATAWIGLRHSSAPPQQQKNTCAKYQVLSKFGQSRRSGNVSFCSALVQMCLLHRCWRAKGCFVWWGRGKGWDPNTCWWGEGGLPVSLPPQLLMTFLCKPQTLTAVFGHRDQAKPFGCKISTTIELPALRNCLLKVGGVKVKVMVKGRQSHCNCQIRAKWKCIISKIVGVQKHFFAGRWIFLLSMCCCRCVLATIVVSAPVAKSVANKLQRRRRRLKLCGLPQSLFSTGVLTILHFYIWSKVSAVAHFSYFMPVAAIALAIDRIRGCKHYENSRHSNFSMFNVQCFL